MRLPLVYLLVLALAVERSRSATVLGDAGPDVLSKRELADPPFWANRGRRTACVARLCTGPLGVEESCAQHVCLQRLIRQDDMGPFWANRGRRDPPFWANRGKRDPPFWANRGKRDVRLRETRAPLFRSVHEPLYVEEPRWILVRRDDKLQQPPPHNSESEYDPFFVTRGKKKAMPGVDFDSDYDEMVLAGVHMRGRRDDDEPFFAARGKRSKPQMGALSEYRTSSRSSPSYGQAFESFD